MDNANSPIEDDNNIMPKVEPGKIADDQAPPMWQQLAQLPDFLDHINSRIIFYQNYLPDGTAIPSLKKKEELLWAWQNATVLIRELETIRNTAEMMIKGRREQA